MSVKAMTAVWQSTLAPYDKLVMMALADSANDPDFTCWPSIPTIARKCSMTERGVQKVMERIDPYIDRNYRVNSSTVYRLKLELLPQACDRGEWGSPVNGVHHRGERGSPEVVNGVHPKRNKETSRKRKSPTAREITNDWRPVLGEETETGKFMATWPPEFLECEIERFIAYHQRQGTKSANFNLNWKTWALSEFCRKALREWQSERVGDGQSGNAFVRAAASRASGGSGGARSSRTSRLL
jgi:hypothetical protein